MAKLGVEWRKPDLVLHVSRTMVPIVPWLQHMSLCAIRQVTLFKDWV